MFRVLVSVCSQYATSNSRESPPEGLQTQSLGCVQASKNSASGEPGAG